MNANLAHVLAILKDATAPLTVEIIAERAGRTEEITAAILETAQSQSLAIVTAEGWSIAPPRLSSRITRHRDMRGSRPTADVSVFRDGATVYPHTVTPAQAAQITETLERAAQSERLAGETYAIAVSEKPAGFERLEPFGWTVTYTLASPEQIARQILRRHAIQPHWNRNGEQIAALIAEAVKEARA